VLGGGGGGGTWVSPQENVDCATISDRSVLNSPVPAVIGQLKAGDVLDIRLNRTGAAPIVEAVFSGQFAGTVTSRIMLRLIECISSGHTYMAEVVNVAGGACTVDVRHR
jgi:hypothetical protein